MTIFLQYITKMTLLLTMLTLLLAPGTVFAEYVNDADVTLVDAAITSVSELSATIDSETTSADDVIAAAEDAEAKLLTIEKHSFSTALGTEYTDASMEVKSNAKELAVHIAAISAVFEATEEQTTEYFDTYGSLIDDLNASLDVLWVSVDEANSGETNLYTAVLVACGLVTIGTLIWSRRGWQSLAKEKRAARKAVVVASIWPLAGALITYLTWTFADKLDGTAFVAWGLILFGFMAYGKAVMSYVATNKAGAEQDNPPAKA